MDYNVGKDSYKNWIISENGFDSALLGKCEAIMCLGNGYMGIRSATEESYVGEKRDTFVAGTFNWCADNEVTELPNVPDVIAMHMVLDGEVLSLDKGEVTNYYRNLNLKTGELERRFTWQYGDRQYDFVMRRFVSMDDLHLIGQRIEITPHGDGTLHLESGIDGQVTNSGAAHLIEGDKRVYDQSYLQYATTTNQSGIGFCINAVHRIDDLVISKRLPVMGRRQLHMSYDLKLEKGKTLVIEKLSNIYTTHDKDTGDNLDEVKQASMEALAAYADKDYEALLDKSAKAWGEKVWNCYAINIVGNDFDQLAARFARYHLAVMTPAHDERMNIGAKGLSGEGYKGHAFWDTEIFMLPFYTFTEPEIAKKLLTYRYLSIEGAHRKAQDAGYQGAMYPWESAALEDGEVTPEWGAADIVSGLQTRIWTGIIEHHVTADIAFALWQYYNLTSDEAFMELCGYEMIFDTAIFWASRVQEQDGRYVIEDVIGPDEYKEHVDNNAYTNHFAHFNVKLAIQYYDRLKSEYKELWTKLNDKLNMADHYDQWKDVVARLYLPQPNEDGIIPQDDTYLGKQCIDLTRYKEHEQVGLIHKEYNVEQVNDIQVSKQADVMLLLYLLESKFDHDTKVKNWQYYEPKTLHDSSLSLSTHSVLASDLKDYDLAYSLFRRATQIDLGPNMLSSDAGIHAASLGGIWQCIVFGFGGLRMVGDKLRIEPNLPKAWEGLSYDFVYQGERIAVNVTKERVAITRSDDGDVIYVYHKGCVYPLKDELILMRGADHA